MKDSAPNKRQRVSKTTNPIYSSKRRIEPLVIKTTDRTPYTSALVSPEPVPGRLTRHSQLSTVHARAKAELKTISPRREVFTSKVVVVNSPVRRVYSFWRNLENLPTFMRHLLEVERLDATRSHWIAAGPAGIVVEWDAEITDDGPNRFLKWKSVGNDNDLNAVGLVRFRERGTDSTQVRLAIRYKALKAGFGGVIESLFAGEPSEEIGDDLARFKRTFESRRVLAAAKP